MSFSTGLTCRDCGRAQHHAPISHCERCGHALRPTYDWDLVRERFDRERLDHRALDIWRYRELLPLNADPTLSAGTGWTPLVQAPALSSALGGADVWLKCDGFSYPSQSFKDRVVAVAINKAVEFEFDTVACPSTGNLANAVAAHASAAGIKSVILIPADLELGKLAATLVYDTSVVRVAGSYDQINDLITKAAAELGWGVVNGNLRPYYAEGSKTVAYEIVEQLDWRTPDWVVAPMAGGSLVTQLRAGFAELARLYDLDTPRLIGAQAVGCSPIVDAFQSIADTGRESGEVEAVKPNTYARSLAIGNPTDGRWAVRSLAESEGAAFAVAETEMREGISAVAAASGVFTETAGGITFAAAKRAAAQGLIDGSHTVVVCLTGNGLKTIEALGDLREIAPIRPVLSDLERAL